MFSYSVFLSFLYFYIKIKYTTLEVLLYPRFVFESHLCNFFVWFQLNRVKIKSVCFWESGNFVNIRNTSLNRSRGCSFCKPNCMPSNTAANHSLLFAFPLLLPCCCKEWKSACRDCFRTDSWYCILLLPKSCSWVLYFIVA